MNTPLLVAKRPALARSERCESCKFVFVDGPSMECHRNPPHGQVMIANGQPQVVACFPPVQPHQYCGEFKSKITVN